MYRATDMLQARSGPVRRFVNRAFYNYLARLDRQGEVELMNYGYADLEPGGQPIPLRSDDEPNRLNLQLYHRVASAVDLAEADVLEVGSGRGGGASYVKRYLRPRSMTGADYSEEAVAFCQQHYRVEGLRFLHGDAESLPFDLDSFDAVINVESSHCYGVMARFLNEVRRVLRPGGHLLWADHRASRQVEPTRAEMLSAGFEIVDEEVITPNILASMTRLGEKNKRLIDRSVPRPARRIFYHFSGVEGTHIYNRLASGELVYLRMALRALA